MGSLLMGIRTAERTHTPRKLRGTLGKYEPPAPLEGSEGLFQEQIGVVARVE